MPMRARISRKLRWIVSEPVLIPPRGSGGRKGMGREFPSGASRARAWAGCGARGRRAGYSFLSSRPGPSERYAVKTGWAVVVPWGILLCVSRFEEQPVGAGVTVPKTAAGAHTWRAAPVTLGGM